MKNLSECGESTSPGYIYPLLKNLKEKEFISFKQVDRKKIYSITIKGKKLLEDLCKNKEEMFSKMISIADDKEKKEFFKIKKDIECMHCNKLLQKFHKTLFIVYSKNKGKVDIILEQAIKKMEAL